MLRVVARIVESTIVLLAVCICIGLLGAHLLHIRFLSIQSNSMSPTFVTGDMVLLQANTQIPAIGSVVAYHSLVQNNVTITHRVKSVNVQSGAIQTQGDNLVQADPLVPAQRVIGRVQLVVARGGTIVDTLRKPIGLFLALVVPLCIICGVEVLRLSDRLSQRTYRMQHR